MQNLLLCTAMLAIYGIFCDFLSAVVAKHRFDLVIFDIGVVLLGFGGIAYGANNSLKILFVCVDHHTADFRSEFGHHRRNKPEHCQKHRNHGANRTDDGHRNSSAFGQQCFAFVFKERARFDKRTYAECQNTMAITIVKHQTMRITFTVFVKSFLF